MTTSLQIKNNVSTYTDISNIFKIDTGATGADANKYQNSNSDIKFVPIIDTNALYTPLKNTQPTRFQINGTDIYTKYMCNYKLYTGITAAETITIGTDRLYNKIVFLLQAAGNQSLSEGIKKYSGGSGACYIGYVDLSDITISSIKIYVYNSDNSGIEFNTTSGVYKIICARGGDRVRALTSAKVTITKDGLVDNLPTSFTTFAKLEGLVGADRANTYGTDSSQNGYTLNPYIQNGDTNLQKPNKISYGNMFQPINSSYDLRGAGGSRISGYEAGMPALGCIWFVKN